ncbi:MAG TPA: phosphodiester glycosidase family protein [Thermoanaerobaculia bacterium]|nr:phosphodiester glycosidase family protein [Thermoanaerobaculia bacterium]
MIRRSLLLLVFTTSLFAADDWTRVTDGVDYRKFESDGMRVHVARVDLTSDAVRVIATPESQRRLKVSDFAKKNKALVAINADYFTKEFQPIGLIAGPCGPWKGSKDTGREGVIAVGDGRARIDPQKEVLERPEPWMEAIVSGWPMLVKSCTPLTASQLPGSDGFTRTPHPRTAVGVSKDGTTMYFVVADGRRDGVPGMTLARLARFMSDELGACAAMNLDGGGSSAMWVGDRIISKPSDGVEREVANHLAVVRASDYPECNGSKNLESPLHSSPGGNRQKEK